MAVETRALDIDGLKAYAKSNPVKFEHKFGKVDFDNLPAGFSIPLYKRFVTTERARRDLTGQSQEIPVITPASFFKEVQPNPALGEVKVVEPAPVVDEKPTDSVDLEEGK